MKIPKRGYWNPNEIKRITEVWHDPETGKPFERTHYKRRQRPFNSKFVATGKYHNQFSFKVYGREKSLELYEKWLDKQLEDNPNFLELLKNKDWLLCTCNLNSPCHVDILIKKLKEIYSDDPEFINPHINLPVNLLKFYRPVGYKGKRIRRTFAEIESDVLSILALDDYLSSSEIAEKLGMRRNDIGKYLIILEGQRLIDYTFVQFAKKRAIRKVHQRKRIRRLVKKFFITIQGKYLLHPKYFNEETRLKYLKEIWNLPPLQEDDYDPIFNLIPY